jgi:hypothetical protein
MATLQADINQVRLQSLRVAALKQEAPAMLGPVLDRIRHMLTEVGQSGTTDRVRAISFEGPQGNWRVSRFSAFDHPWVSVEWPANTDHTTVDWLRRKAVDYDLATPRPQVPQNQLWFFCGNAS